MYEASILMGYYYDYDRIKNLFDKTTYFIAYDSVRKHTMAKQQEATAIMEDRGCLEIISGRKRVTWYAMKPATICMTEEAA